MKADYNTDLSTALQVSRMQSKAPLNSKERLLLMLVLFSSGAMYKKFPTETPYKKAEIYSVLISFSTTLSNPSKGGAPFCY